MSVAKDVEVVARVEKEDRRVGGVPEEEEFGERGEEVEEVTVARI